ncbi:flagellar filament outer layer protein FlaA [Salinispira pacifica]|uniref:Putative flagellar filament outer layer protein FlaA n=1 Tax=Salinispira pacifica TaxID=1307761 RepID=V5WFR2_9SPIO|nr:flagellar filament outer layer protein FlaA [Salinispira pacifica]AHC14657.1 putative flagellar filament outer layer protein FlaA [Salinispira pacifica]
MKKLILISIMFLLAAVAVSAQATEADPTQIGVDTAQQALQEVSISKFEDPGFWSVHIPLDDGVVAHRRFEGGPLEKEPIEAEESANIEEPDEYVLGVRVDYFRRGNTTISIAPVRPIQVPGITKTISMWVVGRNFNHVLNVVVEDFFGRRSTLPMGTLNFSGWKRLTVAVPPTVAQKNAHYNNQQGLKIVGFTIEPAMLEAYGTYYVYFDDLRVWTDLFSEDNRDPDDMVDGW